MAAHAARARRRRRRCRGVPARRAGDGADSAPAHRRGRWWRGSRARPPVSCRTSWSVTSTRCAAADRARLEALGVELRVADPDKDESDMELCLLTALEAGATSHHHPGCPGPGPTRAQPGQPAAPGRPPARRPRGRHRRPRLAHLAHRHRRRSRARRAIEGDAGDFVSLFPLGRAVEGVTTEGLRFPLADETLPLGPSRGLSNELLGTGLARVTTRRGRLLVIHTRRSHGR